MDDEYPFASLQQYPTAGYLFAEELEIHVMALDDFRSCLEGPKPATTCFTDPTMPNSPSSVVYMPPFCPPSPFQTKPVDYPLLFPTDDIFIKPEPIDFLATSTLQPLPVVAPTDERERLRRRQRGYEKRYRGRKRRDLKAQRDTWLALEMKLDATRQKHCKPYVPVSRRGQTSLQKKMLLLLQEERALLEDQVAMKTMQAWEEVSRIREYSDKDELRTVSEWRHSADKVIGQCAILGPRRFHPYAPMALQNLKW